MRKALQALGPIVGAILIGFLAFVAFAGVLTHPRGAVAFVVFAALLFGFLTLRKVKGS